MKNIKFSMFGFYLSLSVFSFGLSFANAQALFPEDGSQKIGTWYYSYSRMPEQVLKAFAQEGVQATHIKYPYMFLQDIAAFDDQGAFIFQSPTGALGDDLTVGVYERMGSYSETQVIKLEHIFQIIPNTSQFELAFFEGGGLISGRFANGEAYVIFNHARFNTLMRGSGFSVDTPEGQKNYHNALAKDLRVKPENLIVVGDSQFANEHLDLYIKALPNGVLLIDDPTQAINVINNIVPKSEESKNNLKLMKVFYSSERHQARRLRYETKIQFVKEELQKRFTVISVPARFFSVEPINGNFDDNVNFLNSVSSINSENKNYFITNISSEVPELHDYWVQVLKPFGFEENHIHFVGRYSSGAGLDCYGAPSP